MYTRKIRATGETLTVARPTEVNADADGGKWVTVCEDHKTMAYSATEKLAYYTHGIDFCDGCREGSPAPTAKAQPAKAKRPRPSPYDDDGHWVHARLDREAGE